MSDETPKASSATAPGALKRCWRALRKPSVKYSFIGIASLFFVLGIIFWGGFNTALEATNTLEFCISCHEMRDNVYQEYKKTIHFSNRTGVRAICSDCHVPHDWTHKLIRKSKASLEVWAKITGRIDTREKFEANRMRLATLEWARMKELPQLRRHEQRSAEADCLSEAHAGEGLRADMHRLPQGHRASLAQGIQRS